MLVRCGRCRTELEVAGTGEFLCPRCGTRNVVRGDTAPGLYDSGGLTVPGGAPIQPPPDDGDAATRWIACPSCSYRFVVGTAVEDVKCPNCQTALRIDESGARVSAQA